MALSTELGADGFVTSLANPFPELAVALWDAAREATTPSGRSGSSRSSPGWPGSPGSGRCSPAWRPPAATAACSERMLPAPLRSLDAETARRVVEVIEAVGVLPELAPRGRPGLSDRPETGGDTGPRDLLKFAAADGRRARDDSRPVDPGRSATRRIRGIGREGLAAATRRRRSRRSSEHGGSSRSPGAGAAGLAGARPGRSLPVLGRRVAPDDQLRGRGADAPRSPGRSPSTPRPAASAIARQWLGKELPAWTHALPDPGQADPRRGRRPDLVRLRPRAGSPTRR